MKDVDTEVRHVTEANVNLFAELGFPVAEAELYAAESRKQIQELVKLKEQLMVELARWISERKLRQEDAADILQITRPRVSDVVNKKTSKFTIDALVTMLGRAGKPVTLRVG